MQRQPSPTVRLVVFLVVLGVVLAFFYLRTRPNAGAGLAGAPTPEATTPAIPPSKPPPASRGIAGAPGSMPTMPQKPKPAEITFQGCPPEGDGNDPALNRLKNRVDEGNYVPVQFDTYEKLPWPKAIERKRRADWSAANTNAVSRYEGIPISVVGYLAGAKEEGPESPNCHGADHPFRDFHIWLTKAAGQDRSGSIVVEATPRVRAKHPGWRTDVLGRIVNGKQRVRISGWSMLDPEHPDQVGKTRGTIWEIHPIMQIEVEQQGRWVALDSVAGKR